MNNNKNKNKNNLYNENNDINIVQNKIDDENEKDDISNVFTRAIIVKDARSQDNSLNVFIKYYDSNLQRALNNYRYKQSLSVVSTDSISLINPNYTNNNKNRSSSNNKYLQQILTSIIEEDEKSKMNPSVNNSYSIVSENDSDKNDTNNVNTNINIHGENNNIFMNNVVIYLTNILQNYYDDNRKMILYLFMRNLKRIQNKLYLQNSLIQYNFYYQL